MGDVCVPFTTDRSVAESWGTKVVCRQVLNGHSGEGIVIANSTSELVDAPLYTKYIPKNVEMRIHVFGGRVIDYARKIRDPSREPSDWSVRSHRNGFIFARNNFTPTEEEQRIAISCVAALGLDFGAVDIVRHKTTNVPYFLEVNTCPGLEGATLTSYAEAILNYE